MLSLLEGTYNRGDEDADMWYPPVASLAEWEGTLTLGWNTPGSTPP